MKKTQGFTLIELLVVIAIIGILSSIVIASLNSARTKGAVSAAKGGAAQIRTQAEVVFDASIPNGGGGVSYGTSTACTAVTTAAGVVTVTTAPTGITWASGCMFNETTIQGQMKQMAANTSSSTYATLSPTGDKWAVSSVLKNGSFYCIDNSGNTKEQATLTVAVAGVCS